MSTVMGTTWSCSMAHVYLVPVLSHGVTDWPEGQRAAGMKAGATVSYRVCRYDFHPTSEFGHTRAGCEYPRRIQVPLDKIRKEWRAKMSRGEKVKGRMQAQANMPS